MVLSPTLGHLGGVGQHVGQVGTAAARQDLLLHHSLALLLALQLLLRGGDGVGDFLAGLHNVRRDADQLAGVCGQLARVGNPAQSVEL